MQVPINISFRHTEPSPAVEAFIREKAAALEKFSHRITALAVVVECPPRRPRGGMFYQVRLHLSMPGKDILVGRDRMKDESHRDVYVAIRDAFNAASRQLQDYARTIRGDVKTHETPPHGTVARVFEDDGYGFIESSDGREIYFHRNSVVSNGGFKELKVGTLVRFVEEMGEKGPQASTVTPLGKHHLVG
ncbi:MAG: HPF/RaiA family ribosome-associated protein [Rhodospirillales bacterium]|nr:HPF/RaiA family ribosome-associated protein [Rhodospirillales bacterium]